MQINSASGDKGTSSMGGISSKTKQGYLLVQRRHKRELVLFCPAPPTEQILGQPVDLKLLDAFVRLTCDRIATFAVGVGFTWSRRYCEYERKSKLLHCDALQGAVGFPSRTFILTLRQNPRLGPSSGPLSLGRCSFSLIIWQLECCQRAVLQPFPL